ncbi:adenosylcobinamide-GDP ribazoletransferase [Cylindrospermopsis curvispora]|uniref:Adenosylcobinamide-GDP ribazoletransferase n=1 Tax=Cylindrospermopsis curvispora GIHE-G1 TaxID=2666332 RepID=A0A7H0F4F4_9CYAN|nr:adenosylcobinamide-GDP ribazoletransferase [Cylindrospermopsis curvispora]QNP30920.1 adenosylcobinamide-GDP ribazoletransferase [Cylindrospermopsis curvispora GIHE-G1]
MAILEQVWQFCHRQLLCVIASVVFYTSIPLPHLPDLKFQRVALFAPAIGLLIGAILGLLDMLFDYLGISALTQSVLIVIIWIGITGGLHLDGAMDTADGLAVTDPQRRLEVMADSATGAFGVMAALAILLMKMAALTDISQNRFFLLMVACGWGRWGQQLAIFQYPYLKSTGKGAFHKQAIRYHMDLLPSWVLLLGFTLLILAFNQGNFVLVLFTLIIGNIISFIVPAWFNHKLGGHTGDTYGAVVEWTEALFLCCMSSLT